MFRWFSWRALVAGIVVSALVLGGTLAVRGGAMQVIAQPASEPDGEGGQPSASAPAAVSDSESLIHMRNDVFYYDYVFVPAGTTITWVNEESDPTDAHNILAEDGSFTSPLIMPGESWEYTFTTPGYYRYVCELHDDMVGAVLVEGE